MDERRLTHTRTAVTVAAIFILALIVTLGAAASARALSPTQTVGEKLFFDTNLSEPAGQSCASCHAANVGWTGPDATINSAGAVYQGAVIGRFGNRKPPAAAYAGDSPVLHYDTEQGTWIGGMFWDGRATGATLGDPLAEQAQGPFLNPLEMNEPDAAAVVAKVRESDYAPLFEAVWGPGIWNDTSTAYAAIARSIAAFERSSAVSAFTSKYDAFMAGKAKLTGQELRGLHLFEGKAGCAGCHVPPLFTDFSYDNLGIPANPLNPFYTELTWNPLGSAWRDLGLGGYLQSAGYPADVYESQLGKFKVPTLRNVDLRPSPFFVKAYGHNGYFKSLLEIVHFYNTRDILPWPPAEVPQNVNHTELGNLGLNHGEELAIVAFLKTLSDGYLPAPQPAH